MASAKKSQPAKKNHAAAGSLHSDSPRAALNAFFRSPRTQQLKEQLCDIGRRLWQRSYVDGNGGNLALRVGRDLALCTPTQVSKGFMQPDDICLVDFTGNQLAGTRRRTSEILMHLQLMQRQPRAVATCHCHSPCATAFAVAHTLPPVGLISEFELFVSVGLAPHHTPGTPALGEAVAKLAGQHNTILMANHGLVTWSHVDLEDAYFKVEILEAYCRTLLVTRQFGLKPKPFTPAQVRDLLKIKQGFGCVDPRLWPAG